MPAPALVRAPLSRGAHPAARRSQDWRSHAACIGLPDRAVFAREPEAARPALRACGICPVRRACLEAVAPRTSWFDGVSGGRLWRNGQEVPVAAPVSLPVTARSRAGRLQEQS
ncbi:WhiB family transcriptional regulator [Streptomyces sp. MBT27]|uniref:WhiB family transcriptional regulator n=1 Tax=Streptomyces sp. MBT27 TaxID=1488356 RepID=UPI001423B4F6|nr:WhiB family transcriptional regulator [Streptomyces sp. MBT27]